MQNLVLNECDYLIAEALDRNGPLPSNYLYAFTRHLRRDRSHLQNRLTEFFHGDRRGPFLTRPPQQFASYRGRYQHIVYDLAPRAKHALAERGSLSVHAQAPSGPFVHRLMSACVSASLELTAPTVGLRYFAFQDILKHPRCGRARTAGNPLALPVEGGSFVIPDLLFGFEYPGAGFRFFTVEVDRNTESITRRNLHQTAFGRKVEAYVSALRHQSYRAWWGVPNLHVLTVTTSATHARNLVDHLREHVPSALQPRFAVTTEPTFGVNWSVPVAVLTHLLTEPWITTKGTRNLSTT